MFFQIQKLLPSKQDCPTCLCDITDDDLKQNNCVAHPKLLSGWFQSILQTFSPPKQMDHFFHKNCLEQWRKIKKEDFHCPLCKEPAANLPPIEKEPTLMQKLSQVHPSLTLLTSGVLTLGTAKILEPLLEKLFQETFSLLSLIPLIFLATEKVAFSEKISCLGASSALGSIALALSPSLLSGIGLVARGWLGSSLLQKRVKTKIDLGLTSGLMTTISGLAATAFGASLPEAAIYGILSSIFYFKKE